MATKEKPYRGVFKAKAQFVALDFWAENKALAEAHAAQVADHDSAHVEVGPLALVRVTRIESHDMVDPGGFYPVPAPERRVRRR